MWLAGAFLSAVLLGFYDFAKKISLKDNAVIPVLFLNTLFCSLIFLPLIILSYTTDVLDGTIIHVGKAGWDVHKFVILKSIIVLASWLFGYIGIKKLPLTIVGPINATRPVMVLVGAMLFFGERLNAWQWAGVILAVVSFFLLSHTGKKEGIDFKHNKGIWAVVIAAVIGAISGLYDKWLLSNGVDRMLVQGWFNIYQCIMMGVMTLLLNKEKLKWRWSILLISLFLSAADFAYFWALSDHDSMISIVSMVRRSSVIVSFLLGAWIIKEKNLKDKAFDLFLVLLGMICLYIGTN
ncbi:MAG: DMT family transporter [Bacteroidales bacterium]|nr:DMT family transporter [Bacteroidales bacterium]